MSSIYPQLLDVQHRLYVALETQTKHSNRCAQLDMENAYLRQEVQHLNQVRADLKRKLLVQLQEQTRTVLHTRACEQERMAAIDQLALLQQNYQQVLAANNLHKMQVTSLTHAFNAYAETQDADMDALRAKHALQMRTLESKHETATQVLTTASDVAWTQRMNAAVEVWKQRCAAKDDKISKLKSDVHQAQAQLAQPPIKWSVSKSPKHTHHQRVAAAIAPPKVFNRDCSFTGPQVETLLDHKESEQDAAPKPSSDAVCELVQVIMAPLPESTAPIDILSKVRSGFIYFLEEHYQALDAYATERLCWHARLMALDTTTTADKNSQQELTVFLRDQVVVTQEKARRELASLHHALECLFQLWIARPGDLIAREKRALHFMLNVIAKTNPHAHKTETNLHADVDERSRASKSTMS
jgi:myosin heavy subunit